MHLVELLLPLYDNEGQRFGEAEFADVRRTLTDRFGGVTAFVRSPAEGLWKQDDASMALDDIVIYEVMVEELDRSWWAAFREDLRDRFRQKELIVRASKIERL